MITIELSTVEEYDKIDLLEGKNFIYALKEKFPEYWGNILENLQDVCDMQNEVCSYPSSQYSEEELIEIFDEDTFAEILEDCYFKDDYSKPDIIKNYYVVDSVGTDKGIWTMVIENGYQIIDS